MKYLIEQKKCNPNKQTRDLWTPLHIAAQLGSYITVEILLGDKRTQINIVADYERGTPLHVAANTKSYQVVQILLMNNANFKMQRNDGKIAQDICNDEALDRLFTKYEEAYKAQGSWDAAGGPNTSNDNIAILEEDDEGDDSEEDHKTWGRGGKDEDFEMKFSSR